MPTRIGDSLQTQSSCVSIEPRDLTLGDSWFAPDIDLEFQEKILKLLLEGQMPDWPVMIPPELRISRKLAFSVENRIVVVVGIGLVKSDGDQISIRTPHIDEIDAESTTIHDSYVHELDLRRDPLGGLGKRTLSLALRRMALAREAAGGLGIIPHVLAHGMMHTKRRRELGFLIYSYPSGVDKPLSWLGDSPDFCRGMENMARFLAALHRKLFHGALFRPRQGLTNLLWTTDGKMIPVVTGWGQHAGLMRRDLKTQDVRNIVEGARHQFNAQRLPDEDELTANTARHVLTAYGQLQAAFKERDFDFESDPIQGWHEGFPALVRKHGLVEQYVTGWL